jgi:hypothetical protein
MSCFGCKFSTPTFSYAGARMIISCHALQADRVELLSEDETCDLYQPWHLYARAREDGTKMNRVEIIRPVVGLNAMLVCIEAGISDQEILEVCNRENPISKPAGWTTVDRSSSRQCTADETRLHILVTY